MGIDIDVAGMLRRGRGGDKRAVAKLISAVEQGGAGASEILAELWPQTGSARIFGITGPPGSGKSTLIDKIVKYRRRSGIRIGVVATDPTSPFTGGAVLGDRIRMGDLTPDPGVFIRSMGTRGRAGGLSHACAGAVNVLDACGFDLVITETAGVGQSEIEVVNVADLVAVVTVPGLGDDVQAIKAGVLEIGDIFIVNKSDRPGADRAAADIGAMLGMSAEPEKRAAPVLLVSAAENTGVGELCGVIEKSFEKSMANGTIKERRARRLRQMITTLIRDEFGRRIIDPILASPEFQNDFEEFLARRENPYLWAEKLLPEIMKGRPI